MSVIVTYEVFCDEPHPNFLEMSASEKCEAGFSLELDPGELNGLGLLRERLTAAGWTFYRHEYFCPKHAQRGRRNG